jgi:hypothetical protein
MSLSELTAPLKRRGAKSGRPTLFPRGGNKLTKLADLPVEQPNFGPINLKPAKELGLTSTLLAQADDVIE